MDPGSQLYVFYSAAEKRALVKTFKLDRVIIPALSVFVDGHLQYAGAGLEGSPVCAIMSFVFRLMHHLKMLFLLHISVFSI